MGQTITKAMDASADKPSNHLTPIKAAKRVGVSRITFYRWLRSGRVPNVKRTPTGRWRIPPASIVKFMV